MEHTENLVPEVHMEEHMEEGDLMSDPEFYDSMYAEQTNLTPDQKLDEDFNYLLAFIPIMLPALEDGRDRALCEDWLERLIGIRARSTSNKRDRNLYLINLMINIGNGTLSSPFDQAPPHSLEKGIHLFGGTTKHPEVCFQNQNIEVEDFADYSRDGRTFFAAKALPGGKGAFGYLGVSLGGGDATWLDCQGKYIDPRNIIKRTACDEGSKETMMRFKSLKNVMSKRSPQKEHEDLVPYYSNLLERIKQITSYYGTDHEIFDPVVEKMLEDLQMDIIREGKIELSNIGCYTKQEWLCSLKGKVEYQMQIAEEREATLNKIEHIIAEHEKDEITFLDISNAIKAPRLDPILAEAARDRPSEHHVTMLKDSYPQCVVKIFLKLVEQEKIHVINQERLAYQNFVTHLRTEVLNEVRRGIDKYTAARKEYRRVSKVLRKIEINKNRILKEIERISTSDDPDFSEKSNLIDNEIASAKQRLEEAQIQSDKIEGKISKLHEQVHQLTSEFQKMEEEGRRETELLLKEISEFQGQIATQQRRMLLLKHKVAEKKQAEACTGQRSC